MKMDIPETEMNSTKTKVSEVEAKHLDDNEELCPEPKLSPQAAMKLFSCLFE